MNLHLIGQGRLKQGINDSKKGVEMSEVLESFKDRLNEVYEVVRTVEVVTKQQRTIRIEILKNYTKGERSGSSSYIARYWEVVTTHLQPSYPKEEGKFTKSPSDVRILWDINYPWVDAPDPDSALAQATDFVAGH
jgi:hypothetical protein